MIVLTNKKKSNDIMIWMSWRLLPIWAIPCQGMFISSKLMKVTPESVFLYGHLIGISYVLLNNKGLGTHLFACIPDFRAKKSYYKYDALIYTQCWFIPVWIAHKEYTVYIKTFGLLGLKSSKKLPLWSGPKTKYEWKAKTS